MRQGQRTDITLRGPGKSLNIPSQTKTDYRKHALMMARENMEDWATSFPVVLDTIRVTVKAFAGGRIELREVPEKTNKSHMRVAPSFFNWSMLR